MNNWKKLWLGAATIVSMISLATDSVAMMDPTVVKQSKNKNQNPEAVQGEYLVQLKSGSLSLQSFNMTLASLGAKVVETVNAKTSLHRVKIVKPALLLSKIGKMSSLSASALQAATVNALSQLSGVEFAEPNFIYRVLDADLPQSVPNDPRFNQLWGMQNLGQNDPSGRAGKVGSDIKAPQAWAIEKGSKNVVVAVIDTGVDYNHKDLKNNMWVKPGTTDVHGYNAINNTENPMDDHSHGTHCSGTIGGEGDNAEGVTGVSWNVSIMGVKFLSAQGGGTLADAVKAIDWATNNGAHIMSNSWGGGGFSQALLDSIQRASDKGIIFIAAAGNDSANNDSSPGYPASYQVPNVISVAAGNNLDAMSSFSNYGRSTVHLMAPGENVMSSIVGGSYASYSGTSMATPHVSGAAALLLAKEPSLTPVQVKERLMATSDKLKAYRTKLISGGRLNVYNLITNTIPPGFITIPDSAWSLPIANMIASKSPYDHNTRATWTVKKEGAKFIRLHFAKFRTESGYDKLRITSGSGELIEELSGRVGAADGFWTTEVEGDTINLEFIADDSVNDEGFVIDSFQWTEFSGN